ncbi:MraY family glycosyltransferase [Desnuesiella massiliensis]|uniref:MraY family glycosyltransferase n=1 Tax=Desnuesiella massiliensis TaxID=1650662 RepID=UPI0006E25C34|nr:MraY family glycosyltransferase [Desnuesiella massiliensis]
MNYFYAFLAVYLIVYFITPFLIKLAVRFDFLDKPTKRKNQEKPMPLVGGVGVFIAFFTGYLIFIRPIQKEFTYILVSSLLVFIIGIVDDWYKSKGKEFAVLPRLIIQMISAFMIYHSGIVFNGFTNPFTNEYIILSKGVGLLLSITWILGVTTVINWSDGVDGLAGSLSAIAGSTLFVVALAKNQTDSAMMSILLVGSLIGFLKYNKYPAQTYIGDSGANFSGFILAIIALEGVFKQATIISLAVPILALGVPIFDNVYVVIKRIIKGKPIYEADASQIHHRLLSTGLNQKQVVMFISLISVCLSLCSIIILLLKV